MLEIHHSGREPSKYYVHVAGTLIKHPTTADLQGIIVLPAANASVTRAAG